MKILFIGAALAVMSFTPLATTETEKLDAYACTVELDCGNGSSASGTAETCRQAGAIAGAGCDASIEMQ